MKRLLILIGLATLCLGAKGCPDVPGPAPTPTPTPADPSPVCQPGATCGCYHRPPGSDWIKLPDCQSGLWCTTPDVGAVMVEPRPPADPAVVAAVNAAARKVAGCAEGPPSRCVVLQPMPQFLAAVVAELRARGTCAGIQDNGAADEVCIETAPGRCQGVHIFACAATCDRGTVAWAPGSVRDTWAGRAPTPSPGPTPGVCGPLRPGPVFKIMAKVHNIGPAKVTLDGNVLFGPDSAYCAKAGWTDGRQNCPVRQEGAPDLAACEDELVGKPTWDGAITGEQKGFTLVLAKNQFEAGREYEFKPCFVVRGQSHCGSVKVTRSW